VLSVRIYITIIRDTLRLLGAIETHRNRAVYVLLNTNAHPTPNPNTNPNTNPNSNLIERNAILWRPVNYNLAPLLLYYYY